MLALTREVSDTIGKCELTHLERQPIDVARARHQHRCYEELLRSLGCEIHRLPAAAHLPDAVFVEDTAVVVPEVAVITRPGADSRRGEIASVVETLRTFRPLAAITPPATLDGGDVLLAGRRIFVGLSSRSGKEAIRQLEAHLSGFGYTVEAVPLRGCLHLKSAVTTVADDTVLLNPEWVDTERFADFRVITVDPTEPAAANALPVGGTVVFSEAFPRTRARLEAHGLAVRTVDLSELAKAEGAVTCCSLVLKPLRLPVLGSAE